jgi:hypothetical protein
MEIRHLKNQNGKSFSAVPFAESPGKMREMVLAPIV